MSREFMLIWDATMSNPNGDMLNDNQPRQDITTGKLEVSDVRIKRFVRDELASQGFDIFVQTTTDTAGKVLSCATRAQAILKGIKNVDVCSHLAANFIDVRLFGGVVTKPKCDITGPLQIAWSKSVNKADIKFMQGNAAYASKDGKEQASIWSKYITPYALFKTYIVYNDVVATRQKISVSEEDIKAFISALIQGLVHYRSTSKNQMPRLLVEVVYKNQQIDGELDYVDAVYTCDDLELRNISQVSFELSRLKAYYENKKDVIDEIRIYKHHSVIIESMPSEFTVINF